jgi:alpha-ketoglutarate-dependent taurine dioxygenase
MTLQLRPLHALFAAEASGVDLRRPPAAATVRAIFRHRWRVGDLVMWGNRYTLHGGRRFDLSQRGELRRTPTEETA